MSTTPMSKPKAATNPNEKDQTELESIETQKAFADQYFHDEQHYWADSYPRDVFDDEPPFRGGKTVKIGKSAPKPAPRPAPVNNPK